MKGTRRSLATGALATVLMGAAPPSPWATMAETDLRSMHDTLLAQHPGPLDAENPAFNQWLEQGHARALERARQATSFEG